VKAGAELSAGLRRACFETLAPLAIVAPLPLIWTEGASPFAVLLYECAVVLLWRWARAGRPARLSNGALNALGLGYLLWLGFEVVTVRHGLLRSVSHLLLFTAVAKLASLKRSGEARTALLVIFLVCLASVSSSTHVSSLLFFLVLAAVGFWTLARLAVLADFEEAPPRRVLRSVPTRGVAAAAIVFGAVLTVPLFYGLPRLRRPFAVVPFRTEDAYSTALAADRVDLESFGSAKRSDQVVLRMEVEPQSALPRVVRLREAVFTEYNRGVWTRGPESARRLAPAAVRAERLPAETRAERMLIGRLAIDLNVTANGFLFLPYGTEDLEVEGELPRPVRDGVVQVPGGSRSVRYTAAVRGIESRSAGSSVINPASVPEEVRAYAQQLTAGLTEPIAIYERIRDDLARHFFYTLDPPHGGRDPVVNFLLRSKAGHCEFFASAAALMLTARGVPARLVTGSYGGELGLFSHALIVRGSNLHAWVEARIDGRGFTMLDPTPEAGIPPAESRLSWRRLFSSVGHEIEFFYDRRILGFDSLDQARIFEAARQALAGIGRGVPSFRQLARRGEFRVVAAAAAFLLLAAFSLLALENLVRRRSASAATRAYVRLRALLARRAGSLSEAVPPLEVARRFGEAAPEGGEDARAVVFAYCDVAFGGRTVTRDVERDLSRRLRRLKKLA
jgi:transglutaminase-like putative cysteine protease